MTGAAQVRTFDFSNPELYNSAYIPLFKNKSEFLHLFGSAGSGKSRFAAQKEIVKSFIPHRKGRKTLVIRKVAKTLKDSVYSELKSVIYNWKLDDCFEMLKSPLQLTNKLTGVEFLFIGLDDVEKVKSISGVDRIWIEEATELDSINELHQLRLRLRGFEDVQITLSYNPINVHHWLNTEIHERPHGGHDIFKSTYRDNERLLAIDPHYADSIERLKHTNPNYYKVYGLGEWGQDAEGLVYPEYSQVDDMPGDPQFYGLDFGHNDPTALVACFVRDALPKKEFFVKELLYRSHLNANELIAEFKSLAVSTRMPIICDSARPEMIDSLKKAGYNARPCTKYKGSVLDGINRVKTFTIRPVIGGKNLFREIQNYSWLEKDGKYMDDEPKDAINHLMDAMRYGSEAINVGVWSQGTRTIR
jgi:phage terminase large subunit